MELPPGAPVPHGRQRGAPSGGAGRSRRAFAAGALVDSAVVLALHSAGFRRSSAEAIGMLGEVMQRYISRLGSNARDCAEASNRTTPHLRDVCASLEDVGVDLDELFAWLPQSSGQASSASVMGPDAPALSNLRLRASTLIHPEEEADPPPSRPVLQYLPRDPVDRRHALAAAVTVPAENGSAANGEAMDLDSSLSDAGDALFSPSSGPSSRTSFSAEPPETCSQYLPFHEFIPSHLPPLPTLSKHERSGSAASSHLTEIPERISSPSPPPSPSQANTQAPSRPSGSSHDTVPFSTSRFAQEHGADAILDLPRIDSSLLRKRPVARSERDTSLYAYAANLRALQAEPTSSATANYKIDDTDSALPDPAMRLARAKRRRIAATVADVGQFSPADTLYAGVPVRANVPFVPAPSILVTVPPPQPALPGEPPPHMAPLLSMTHPHGQSVALFPPSGALQPALGYRWPAQVASAAMAVADHDVRRRVSRLMDPAPLLDDKGTERVFHGKPAPRHLLGLSYGALAPAINELRSNWQAAHPGGEFTDPQRGTLVYTWDWAARDPYDRNLPGKVFQPPNSSALPPQPPSPAQRHSKTPSHSRSPAPIPPAPSHPLAQAVGTEELVTAEDLAYRSERENGHHAPDDQIHAGQKKQGPPSPAGALPRSGRNGRDDRDGRDRPSPLSPRYAPLPFAAAGERVKQSPPPAAAAALLAPLSRSPRLSHVALDRAGATATTTGTATTSRERTPLSMEHTPHAGAGRAPSSPSRSAPIQNGLKEHPRVISHSATSVSPAPISKESAQATPPPPQPTSPPSTSGVPTDRKQPPQM